MQITGGAGKGGAEIFFGDLVQAFQNAGISQLVVSRQNSLRDPVLQAAGIENIHLHFGGALDWQTPRKLRKIAQSYNPDIVLSWMCRAASMMPSGPFLKVGRLDGYYDLKYFTKCDRLVCITKELCDHAISSGWDHRKVHYIPNFINWKPAPAIDRAMFDTPDDVPLLLALARLDPVKGLDTAIRSLVHLADSYLWIAGNGPLEAELKQLAKDMNVAERVRFLGWRDDREALLAAADIAVFPSRKEGFGLVMLEAWASGTPIVATKAQGPAAYIDHLKTGLLAQIDNVDAFSGHIQNLLDDPDLSQAISRAGIERYMSGFTEQAAIKNWQDFFKEISG